MFIQSSKHSADVNGCSVGATNGQMADGDRCEAVDSNIHMRTDK